MKKWLMMGMTVLLLVGLAGAAYAASAKSNPPSAQSVSDAQQSESASNAEDKDAESADDQKQEGDKQEVPDSVEQANLQKQATITQDNARKTALEHQAGTVAGSQLEDEDGHVVYNVQIEDSNGQSWEVKVDAKSGAFIKSEKADTESGNDSDQETNDDGK